MSPEQIRAQKQALRDKIGILKRTQTPADITEKSERIKELLFELPEFKSAGRILFYATIYGEVETKDMIEEALSLGKRVALPKVSGQKLVPYEITSLRQLEKNSMSIPEPKEGHELPLNEVDLIILPGIAFDRSGNRLGRGKGYYDRLLSEAGEKMPKIALAFEFQIVGQVPSDTNDQKMGKIITENESIRCQ